MSGELRVLDGQIYVVRYKILHVGEPMSDPDGNNLQFPDDAARLTEGRYEAEEQSGRSPGVEKPQVTSALWSLFRLRLSRG